MAHNYRCGQFNDAFHPKRLGNWCDNTHPHDKICCSQVCQFRRRGHLNFIADDRGHLLPEIRQHVTMKPNHWGYPFLRVWDYNNDCGCQRPRRRAEKKPIDLTKLPKAFAHTDPPVCCKDKTLQKLVLMAQTRVQPIPRPLPKPQKRPRRMTEIGKQFEFIRGLGIPIIWIYGFPMKSIAWTRKYFIRQLLARLGYVYIDMEAKMRSWAQFLEDALDESPPSTAGPPPRRKTSTRRKPNLSRSETFYSYPTEPAIRRPMPTAAGSRATTTAASTRPTTPDPDDSVMKRRDEEATVQQDELMDEETKAKAPSDPGTRPPSGRSGKRRHEDGKSSKRDGRTTRTPTDGAVPNPEAVRRKRHRHHRHRKDRSPRPNPAEDQTTDTPTSPNPASPRRRHHHRHRHGKHHHSRPKGSPRPGSKPGAGHDTKKNAVLNASKPASAGSSRPNSKGPSRPTTRNGFLSPGTPSHKSKHHHHHHHHHHGRKTRWPTNGRLNTANSKSPKRRKKKKKREKKPEDNDGLPQETSRERMIHARNERLAIKVRYAHQKALDHEKRLEEFRLILKESERIEAAMGGAADKHLDKPMVTPDVSSTGIGEDYYRFKALKELEELDAKAETESEKQEIAWKRAAIIAQTTDMKLNLPKKYNDKAAAMKNARLEEFFQSKAGQKYLEEFNRRKSEAEAKRNSKVQNDGTANPPSTGGNTEELHRGNTGDDSTYDDDFLKQTTEGMDDLPALHARGIRLHNLPKTIQRGVRLMAKLVMDPTEAFSCAGVLEMIKLAMLSAFPCKGFIIDGFPTTMEESNQFEEELWPMSVGLYFMNVAWTNDKSEDPAVIEPRLFRRCIDYSEKEVEHACDSSGYKTIKIRHAENIDTREINFINSVVDRILSLDPDHIKGEIHQSHSDPRLAGIEQPYHTPLQLDSISGSLDNLDDDKPKTPAKAKIKQITRPVTAIRKEEPAKESSDKSTAPNSEESTSGNETGSSPSTKDSPPTARKRSSSSSSESDEEPQVQYRKVTDPNTSSPTKDNSGSDGSNASKSDKKPASRPVSHGKESSSSGESESDSDPDPPQSPPDQSRGGPGSKPGPGGGPSTGQSGGQGPASGPSGRGGGQGPASGPSGRGGGQAPASGPGGQGPASGPSARVGGQGPASGSSARGVGQAPASGPGGQAPASGPGGQAPASGPGGQAPASGPGGQAPASGPSGRGGGQAPASGPSGRGGGQAPASVPAGQGPASGPSGRDGGQAPASGPFGRGGGQAPASAPAGQGPASGPSGRGGGSVGPANGSKPDEGNTPAKSAGTGPGNPGNKVAASAKDTVIKVDIYHVEIDTLMHGTGDRDTNDPKVNTKYQYSKSSPFSVMEYHSSGDVSTEFQPESGSRSILNHSPANYYPKFAHIDVSESWTPTHEELEFAESLDSIQCHYIETTEEECEAEEMLFQTEDCQVQSSAEELQRIASPDSSSVNKKTAATENHETELQKSAARPVSNFEIIVNSIKIEDEVSLINAEEQINCVRSQDSPICGTDQASAETLVLSSTPLFVKARSHFARIRKLAKTGTATTPPSQHE